MDPDPDPDPRIHLSVIVDPDPRIHIWKKWIRIRVPILDPDQRKEIEVDPDLERGLKWIRIRNAGFDCKA